MECLQEFKAVLRTWKTGWNLETGCLLKGCAALGQASGDEEFLRVLDAAAVKLAAMEIPQNTPLPEAVHCGKVLIQVLQREEPDVLRPLIDKLMRAHAPIGAASHIKEAYMQLPFSMAYEMQLHGMEKVAQVVNCFRLLRAERWDDDLCLYAPVAGKSAGCLRANGWMLMALVDGIEVCSEQLYEHYRALVDLLREGVRGALRHVGDDGLLPHRAGDDQGDAMASMMMAYCLLKAVRLGLIDPERYLPAARSICRKVQTLPQVDEEHVPAPALLDGLRMLVCAEKMMTAGQFSGGCHD